MNINAYKKIRRSWDIKPIEKIKESKKIYNRNRNKQEVKMELNRIESSLFSLIEDYYFFDSVRFNIPTKISELGLTNKEISDLAVDIEETFCIDLSDEEINSIETIQDLVDEIAKRAQ